MEKLFVQFYRILEKAQTSSESTTYFSNGFGAIEHLVVPTWLNIYTWRARENIELFKHNKEIYVSVWYTRNISIISEWAQQCKDQKFIIGGPAVCPSIYHPTVPENVIFEPGMLEDALGLPYDATKWGVSLKDTGTAHRLYSFPISDTCYWGQCTYCNIPMRSRAAPKRRDTNIDFSALERAPSGTVFLSTPSLAPSHVALLKELDFSNKTYQLYIRADKQVQQELEKLLPSFKHTDRLMFMIGVEFPSSRMLEEMRKGASPDDLLALINLLDSFGIRKILLYIEGWDGLTHKDVDEAEQWLRNLSDAHDERTWHRISKYQKPNISGSLDFVKCVHEEAIDANKRWKELLESSRRVIPGLYNGRPAD